MLFKMFLNYMYFVNCLKEVIFKFYKLFLYLDRIGIELFIGVNNKVIEEYINKRYLLIYYVINNCFFVKWFRKW